MNHLKTVVDSLLYQPFPSNLDGIDALLLQDNKFVIDLGFIADNLQLQNFNAQVTRIAGN